MYICIYIYIYAALRSASRAKNPGVEETQGPPFLSGESFAPQSRVASARGEPPKSSMLREFGASPHHGAFAGKEKRTRTRAWEVSPNPDLFVAHVFEPNFEFEGA